MDASGRSYGTVGAYTYDRGTMSIDVRSFGLPVHSLPAGGVRFSMVVGAYGTQLTLLTQAFPVVCVPTVVELGRIGRSSYALVDGQSVNVPFTLRNASSAVPIDVALRTSTEVVRSCVEWRPSSSFAVDTSGLALVSSTSVSTTVTARVVAYRTVEPLLVTIIHVQTRTRIALPVSSDIVYTYPTAVYFALRSGPYARMNTSTPIIATFESVIRLPLPIGASYSITATGGSVANASSAALPSDTSGLAFSFTPSVDAETTARVTMTFGGTQVALTGVLLRDDQILGPPVMSLSDRVLVYNTPSVAAMSFADATSLLWPFFGTTAGDMVQYVKWTRGTSPVWAVDSSGYAPASRQAWPDELGEALVCALPLDSVSTGLVDVCALAGGVGGALSVATVGVTATTTSRVVWKYYGSSVAFNGTNTSVRLTGLPVACLQADWTIECWVLTGSLASTGAAFGVVDASGGVLLKTVVNRSTGVVSVHALDSSGLSGRIVTTTSAVVQSSWTHLAVVDCDGRLALYVNGVATTPSIPARPFWFSTRPIGSVVIGQNGIGGEMWSGNMTDFRIYTTAKYTCNFSASFTTEDVELRTVVRAGQTLLVPFRATSYRRARLFAGVKRSEERVQRDGRAHGDHDARALRVSDERRVHFVLAGFQPHAYIGLV